MSKLPKRPKRPKRSSSIRTWERYDLRMREWEKKLSRIKSDKKRKEAIIRKYSKY